MNIYISSRGRAQEACRALALLFERHGHSVTSSWLEEDLSGPVSWADSDWADSERMRDVAERDIRELDQSDVVLLVAYGCERVPGGVWWEAGYAHAKGIPVKLIGPDINVFCSLAESLTLRDFCLFLKMQEEDWSIEGFDEAAKALAAYYYNCYPSQNSEVTR